MVPTLGASRGGAVASMSANVRHAARVTRRSAVMPVWPWVVLRSFRALGSWGACSSMVPLRLPRGVRHVPSICYAGPRAAGWPRAAPCVPLGATGWHARRALGVTEWHKGRHMRSCWEVSCHSAPPVGTRVAHSASPSGVAEPVVPVPDRRCEGVAETGDMRVRGAPPKGRPPPSTGLRAGSGATTRGIAGPSVGSDV